MGQQQALATTGARDAQHLPAAAASTLSATEYRLLVEHSPVMIWRSGLDANCDYFNDTWLAFTGRTLEQESGNGWAEGVHPEDLDRCVAHYLEHFGRREPFEMEYRLRRRDGEFRWIFDRGVPFCDDSGAFAGFVGSCVDVHERRLAQETQQQHNREQLALARDFEKWILAIVSHDIRNPLSTIHMASAILQQMAEPPDFVRNQAQVVMRAAERIRHLVSDLLDLARVREGAGLVLEPRTTDLRRLCQRIIEELAAVARDRRIAFDCAADVEGSWDEHRLLQAISNLTANAVQHGAPGAPVRVRLSGDAANVAVEVENEGSIPDDLLPHIFEPFRSSRHHAGRGDGLGLGLFIARAIACAHGGSLECESAAGTTSFRMVLPRHVTVAAAA